jgi:hypothetical protein
MRNAWRNSGSPSTIATASAGNELDEASFRIVET